MTINLKMPDPMRDLKPRITVFGVGGAGGNAVNNMIQAGLEGVEFVVANTDAQALAMSSADRRIQMGAAITEGLGAGSQPQIGAAAAEEAMPEILDHIAGSHMVFITAGMGGGTGTGAAPVIARLSRDQGILTIGVVTKPFQFEGARRMQIAERGIEDLEQHVDTLIVIPNQNLFRVANERTTFADAFAMADQVLYSGVAGITDLMVKEGLINLDFADVRTIMNGMGKAMMGTGEASGEKRATEAAEAAISNPLLDDVSMRGARGLLISITGGEDLTLYEVDEAATRIRAEVDPEANVILGATFDNALEGYVRVSVVATGIDGSAERRQPETLTLSGPEEQGQRIHAGHRRPRARQPEPAQDREPAYLDDEGDWEDQPHGGDPRGYADDPRGPREAEVTIRRIEAAEGFGLRHAPPPREREAPRQPARDPREPFIPPAASRSSTDVRMPRIDEFPVVAQREMRARERGGFEPHGVESQKRKAGFLERLAHGLGRREPEPGFDEPHQEPRFAAEADYPDPRQLGPDGDRGGLRADRDSRGRGRPAPARRTVEFTDAHAPQRPPAPAPADRVAALRLDAEDDDDHLEIPAFLRRQAN
jgi:cell division protein FtsZ